MLLRVASDCTASCQPNCSHEISTKQQPVPVPLPVPFRHTKAMRRGNTLLLQLPPGVCVRSGAFASPEQRKQLCARVVWMCRRQQLHHVFQVSHLHHPAGQAVHQPGRTAAMHSQLWAFNSRCKPVLHVLGFMTMHYPMVERTAMSSYAAAWILFLHSAVRIGRAITAQPGAHNHACRYAMRRAQSCMSICSTEALLPA